MKKQELIDECIVKFNGEFPVKDCNFISLRHGNSGVYAPYYVTYEREDDTLCTKQEFQQRAKELGYGADDSESWYDYESQKAIKLPPVGAECLVFLGNNFKILNCYFVGMNSIGSLVIEMGDGELKSYHNHQVKLKPLDWNRKAEQERKRVVDAVLGYWNSFDELASYTDCFSKLYDAGFLKLPEQKDEK